MNRGKYSEEQLMRPPEMVMRLDRMGSSHQTRLSFMRSLVRRMSNEKWQFECLRRDVDNGGFGVSVYAAKTPNRTYSLIAFTQDIPPNKRTDRVIAEVWDATFSLFDGIPTQSDIDYLALNTPKQEGGRFRPSELVLARANKSLRLFEHVISSLAKGNQPDIGLLSSVGYLMRTTAVYGSGKFGCADRDKIANREECRGAFQIELLAVYLIRWFTVDLVEYLAKKRGGNKAAKLNSSISQFLGIGNSTGLGMAPFLLKHPTLIHRWAMAKETALARVRGIKVPKKETLESFIKSLEQVSKHLAEWRVGDEVQTEKISCLKGEIRSLIKLSSNDSMLKAPYPWNHIYKHTEENFSLECQEIIVSLVIEPHGYLVDDLAESMFSESIPKIDVNMKLGNLKEIINTYYNWATSIDFTEPNSQHHFWYYSEDKLEPRFGSRDEEDGSDQEMPLTIGRDVNELNKVLLTNRDTVLVGEFVLSQPQFRHIIRRIQNTFHNPYSEIQDNLLDESMMPLNLLRFKLAFFGASKFDPKSELWTRISMYQGAPVPENLSTAGYDNWYFPVIPKESI
ncbi:MAG: hypothetical protein QF399_06760 [Gammaproteobacteria bacterium]|nr:hypothetical protein [Gammaproteobacteria bacterium]